MDFHELPLYQNWALLPLSNRGITELPVEIGNLTNLERLELSCNKLSSLPSELGNLTKLEELDISGNKLSSLPPELGNLTGLRRLCIKDNKLSSLPSELGNLTKLEELDISGNKLSSLPPELGNLTGLRRLCIKDNKLSSLPSELGNLTKLEELDISGNRLLPEEILSAYGRGMNSLLIYLRDLANKNEIEPQYEAKLLLIGEGKVGKSSLLAALRKEGFRHEIDTTHGVETHKLCLPHPTIANVGIQLNAWDFGGQRVYQATHQFFFSRRSIYLLLWDLRQDITRCDVYGWIKRIRLRVGEEARIVIVATHTKTGERIGHIDKAVLCEQFGSIIAGFAETDTGVLADGKTPAKEGDKREKYGVAELKKLLAREAAKLPQMGNSFNKRWKAAREETLALREKLKDRAFIVFDEFAAICGKHKMDEPATRELAAQMHDFGYVLHYYEYESLAQWMILQPEWVTKAIGYVLEDEETNRCKGVLAHSRLRGIWFDHGKKGRERYALSHHPFFLRLMEQFDASYRFEHESKDWSLVAQLVPDARPKLPWLPSDSLANGQNQIDMVCELDEEPPGLIPWMIVRTHYYATPDRLHWRHGMFLRLNASRGHCAAEAFLELRERQFFITVRSEFPEYFMTILRNTIETLIFDRWNYLKERHNFSVRCKGKMDGKACDGLFYLDSLFDFRKQGMDSIPCQSCRTKQMIDKLIWGFDPPVNQNQLLLKTILNSVDEIKTLHEDMQRIITEQTAKFQKSILTILKTINAENNVGPALVSILPLDWTNIDPRHLFGRRYRLNLWCEYLTEQHPVCQIGSEGAGEYVFTAPAEWLKEAAPYLSLMGALIRGLLPFAQITGACIPSNTEELMSRLDLMTSGMKDLMRGELNIGHSPSMEERDVFWKQLQGNALRSIHRLIQEEAKKKGCDPWGGLRRTVVPTGGYLWLCPKHYKIYEPGLPVLYSGKE